MFKRQTHKQILENLSTSVVLLDGDLRITYMNPAAEMLLAATAKRLENCNVEQWLSSDPHELAVLKRSIEAGHPYTRREAKLVTMNGQELTVDYSVNPLPLQNDTQLIIEIQARDRLLRIEREEELLARHATTRNLVRGMAHEIKNPLGGIRGAAQLLERAVAGRAASRSASGPVAAGPVGSAALMPAPRARPGRRSARGRPSARRRARAAAPGSPRRARPPLPRRACTASG